jgi:excisionase family DNA binding protein
MPQTPAPDLIASIDVARQLGINRSTLTRWIKDGTAVPSMRMPGRTGAYLFSRDELDRLLESRSSPAA